MEKDKIGTEKMFKSKVPLEFRKVLDWNQLKWSLSDWQKNLDNTSKKYPFRKGVSKCSNDPQWERTCEIKNLTMEEFFELMNGNEFKVEDSWMYFDYKHLNQWFNHNISLENISWSCLGLPEIKFENSTLWIGTKGAHTPCHYDSYSCNIIAQLYGRKMWLLFPPSQTINLKPTRVPYEESSIYSEINFHCGCCDLSNIKEARLVILDPGDILYVPKNWWHYVENLTPAISINSWLPMESDDTSRLEESLAKFVISSIVKDIPDILRLEILNPNEDDLSFKQKDRLSEIEWCLQQHLKIDCNDNKQKPDDDTPSPSDTSSTSSCSTVENLHDTINDFDDNNADNFNLNTSSEKSQLNFKEVPIIQLDRLQDMLKQKCTPAVKKAKIVQFKKKLEIKDVINAFCHPDVLNLVKDKLTTSFT